jgi:hypothetical protein
MCVPSLVEIAPGVPELCPDIHTYIYTNIHFYRYRFTFHVFDSSAMCIQHIQSFFQSRLSTAVRSYFTIDSQSVSMSWYRAPFGTCDQISFPVGMLLSEICGLVSVGSPLWREDGSAVCSAITQWSGSRRTPNLEGQFPVFISPRNRAAQLYTPGHWVPFTSPLSLAGLQWRYSNPPPHGDCCFIENGDSSVLLRTSR